VTKRVRDGGAIRFENLAAWKNYALFRNHVSGLRYYGCVVTN
jgi:hypothetical protein